MQSDLRSHICDDRLDLYALNQLSAAETAEFEEHLLVCAACRDRLSQTDRFIAALRYAAAALDPEAVARPKPVRVSTRAMGRSRYVPVVIPLIAAALILSLALTAWPPLRPARPLSEAVLRATRGGSGVAELAVARVTQLDLDTSELTGSGTWQIVVVNKRGSAVWTATGRDSGGMVPLRIGLQLSRGSYWVRLYDRTTPGVLVREYGFAVP